MKINKVSKKTPIVLASFLAAILLASGIAFSIMQQNNATQSNEEQTKAVDETSSVKENQVEDSGNSSNDGASLPEKTSSYAPVETDTDNPDSSTSSPERPTVSRANQSNDQITVVATFQQESAGYCELQLTQPGQTTISRQANIVVGPSFYTCGFRLQRSEIPNSGQWAAVIIHHIGSNSTSSNPETFEVL